MPVDECADMVTAVRNAKRIVGKTHYGPTEGELSNYKFRRSLFAVSDIREGEIFNSKNIRSIRPAAGIKPKNMNSVIGRKAKCDIKAGTPSKEEYLQ